MPTPDLFAPAQASLAHARVCGTCTHGKHLTGQRQRRLGWTACELQEASKFFPEGRACVNGQWRSAPQVKQPAAAVTAAPADAASDAEQQWWNATGA